MASKPMPSSKWIVTITGCSFKVTVQAPNAPCRQTNRNSAVGSAGANSARLFFFHWRHACTIIATIKTPMAMAR